MFLIFHLKKFFYSKSSLQLNNYVQDVQVPLSPKPCLKIIDRWPCFMKPFVFQKTPYSGKIPTKKVFPIVWFKRNFWCEALRRPEKKLKALKGYRLSMETQGWLEKLFCKYTSKGCSGALVLLKQLTFKHESTKRIGKELSTSPATQKSKVLQLVHFCKL